MLPLLSLSKKLRIAALFAAGSLATLGMHGCATLPESAAQTQAAASAAAPSARRESLTAIGLKPLNPDEAAGYMDRAQTEIETLLKTTDVTVVRKDRDLIVTLPGDLSFGSGRAVIEPSLFKLLNGLSEVLDRYDSTYIDILGHADSSGRKKDNERLSEQRANSTAAYLVAHHLDYQRLRVAGVGSAFPLVSNNKAKGRAQNRRVEIIIRPLT